MFSAATLWAVLHVGWIHVLAAVLFSLHMMRETVQIIFVLIKNLPEILALLKTLQADIHSLETDRKVKTDLTAMTEAINAKDASRVSAIFNAPAGLPPGSVVQPDPAIAKKS